MFWYGKWAQGGPSALGARLRSALVARLGRAPAEQPSFGEGEQPLGEQRDDREDGHRRVHPGGVERPLRGGHEEAEPLGRADVLADDRADQRETEADMEA